MDPHIYRQLISDKGAKAKTMEQRYSFQQMMENWTPTCKKMNLNIDFSLFTKINSKWIRDTNMKCKTIKSLEDNIGKNLQNLGYGDAFLDITPKTQSERNN